MKPCYPLRCDGKSAGVIERNKLASAPLRQRVRKCKEVKEIKQVEERTSAVTRVSGERAVENSPLMLT